jgi:hypothetical protein
MSKGPDWAKTGTIVAMAEWLREKSGAFAVVVVRRDDAALVADPRIAPGDARELLLERLPALALDLAAARAEKRKGARLEMEPPRE